MSLMQEWLDAKAIEAQAIERRRAVEDALRARFGISDALEGAKTVEQDGYKIKITGRIDRKVDGEALQELASEAGLSDHLSSLFRWTPAINMGAWKAASPSITEPLAKAITAKPGRPSFSITINDKDD